MTEIECIVQINYESCDLRALDWGATAIDENCHFEDASRGEHLVELNRYKRDYYRWRVIFPNGKVVEGHDCDNSTFMACQFGLIDE